MEKVTQRTQAAIRHATRRTAKRKKHVENGQAWARRRTFESHSRFLSKLIVEERSRRREDWFTGPLASRRDVGDLADKYGTLPIAFMHLPEEHPERRPDWVHIFEGDRVVVTKGRDKGKIGEVMELQEERAAVRVKGINKTDVNVPEFVQQEDRLQPLMTMERSIPLSDVKLVHPLLDPKTGIPRDVVIDRLEPVGRKRDRKTGKLDKGERFIPGTDTIIPWPEQVEPEELEYEEDSTIDVVQAKTFRPHLLMYPMPEQLIDELRGKYSKFRKRHDWHFVQRKEAQAAREGSRSDLIKTVRTPLQELAELRMKQKKEQEKDLSSDELARIGEIISQEQAKAKDAVKEMLG